MSDCYRRYWCVSSHVRSCLGYRRQCIADVRYYISADKHFNGTAGVLCDYFKKKDEIKTTAFSFPPIVFYNMIISLCFMFAVKNWQREYFLQYFNQKDGFNMAKETKEWYNKLKNYFWENEL